MAKSTQPTRPNIQGLFPRETYTRIYRALNKCEQSEAERAFESALSSGLIIEDKPIGLSLTVKSYKVNDGIV